MYKKFYMFMFLNLIVVLILKPMVCADGRKNPTSQIRTSPRGNYVFEWEPVTWDNIMNGVWGDVTHGIKDPEASPVFDDYGLVPGEEHIVIDSTDPWSFDNLTSLEPAVADEFGNVSPDEGADPGIVIGIKYLFKRFQFDRFRRSILSFISNSNKTASGTPSEVAFYVDVP
ncbi:MAG: hypothetical protein JSV50_04135 [Desulfobacteraceae bacterium]|nr:MAG: hypothetical protein JSV50_04135 [Desulfobacteraceae bacterium]